MGKLPVLEFSDLETNDLLLRRLNSNDKNEIFAIRSDPGIAEFLDRPLCKSKEEALQFIDKINSGIERNECLYWAITTKNDRRFAGTICLWNFSEDGSVAEVGFELLPSFQGKGIMREALGAIICFGFEKINLVSIEGMVHRDNRRSIKALKRNNFKLKPETVTKEFPQMITYQLLRS